MTKRLNTQFETMDEFADHEGSSRGSRDFLSWKKQDDGQIDVYLLALPWKAWRHTWKALRKYKDEGSEVEKTGMYSWVTMETDEELLKKIKKQGYKWDADPEDFDDRHVPEVDPFLKLLEWVYRHTNPSAVENDKDPNRPIDWLDPIFSFEPEDEKPTKILAGGFCDMYPDDFDDLDFSDEKDPKEAEKKLKRRFQNADVVLKLAYKQAAAVRLQYLFCVVDAEKPEDGPKLAFESESLGNCLKSIVRKRRERLSKKYKDPKELERHAAVVKNVRLRWTFDNAESFSKKYDMTEIEEEIPEAVLEAFEKELPDVDPVLNQGNVAFLEANFRKHWCHDVKPPWDEIFADAYKLAAIREKEDKVDKGTYTELPSEFGYGANAKSSARDDDEPEKGDVSMVDCEACGKPMPETEMTCPHCKAEYVTVGKDAEAMVCLRSQKCSECGKEWFADELACSHCGAEFELKGDAFVAKPKPKSEAETTSGSTPRRRRATT